MYGQIADPDARFLSFNDQRLVLADKKLSDEQEYEKQVYIWHLSSRCHLQFKKK